MIGVIQAILKVPVGLAALAELAGFVLAKEVETSLSPLAGFVQMEELFGLRQAVLLQQAILLALVVRQAAENHPLPA